MGIVFRQSAKNAIVAAMGALLGALVIWLSTKYTTKQELGFTRNLTNYAVTFSQFLLLGVNNALTVYIHKYTNSPAKRNSLVTLSLAIPLVPAFIFTIGCFLLKPWILNHFQPEDIPFMDRYFTWLPLFTVFFVYMVLLEQYLGSQMKVAVSAFMREVVVRVANIVLILLYGFGYVNFDVLVIGMVLIYLLPLCVFVLLMFRIKDFGLTVKSNEFSNNEYKDMSHFAWYHFLLTASIVMINYMDAMALPLYDKNGFKSVAIYGVAAFIISFIQLPFKALMPASFTVLAKAFNDNDMDKAKDIFRRASVNILIPCVGMAVLIYCNLSNAVTVINNDYSAITPVVIILSIGRLFEIATGMTDQVLSIAKYYKFNFYLSLLLMVVLFGMLRVLIPHYGLYGAAMGTSITVILFNFIKFLFIRKKLDMQPFSRNTILVIVAALPAFAAGYFFPHFFDQTRHIYVRTFADVCIRSTIIVIVYMLMLWWLKPSADLREYIATVKKNKRLF
ncbi:MAG: polysaccharide biosynthesis protein [Flavipsychrobacter sp.]|jgi:O-antigen/teichoic acid export membrane protein|nr:polysaccharide biosynthesis protein [Flavipsychrobacter sp.]